jgi:hypothetical protein
MQWVKQMLLPSAVAAAVSMALPFVFARRCDTAHSPVDSLGKRLNAELAKTV